MKHQVKPSVLFAIVKIVEMNYTGHVCRLIVDELPVDAYGMKVLAAARELWVKQGKVCVGTGRTIGSSFPVVQIIGGEPMNVATKVEAGREYTSSGVPNCSMTPSFMTIMRWASVMAST